MTREKSRWCENFSADKWINEYPEGSLFKVLKTAAEKYPDYVAIEFEGKKTTYKSFIAQVEIIAKALIAINVKKGDMVTVVTPNTPQSLFLIYAVNRIGAVANILHPLLPTEQIVNAVENTDSVAILTLDMIYPKFKKTIWKTSHEPKMILARICDALPWFKAPVYNAKNKLSLTFAPEHDIIYWNEFISLGKNSQAPLPADDGANDDTSVILYSGGTSGDPKGIMLSNYSINALAVQCYDIGNLESPAGLKSLAIMPIFHGYGLCICLHAMLMSGLHIFLIPKYDFNACNKLIFKKKINAIYGVPGLFEAFIRCEGVEKSDLSFIKLLISGGDKLPEKLQSRVNKKLKDGGSKAFLREAYGQTECVAGCATTPYFAPKFGSPGIAYNDMQFKIVEPGTENELPIGEDGELCISGPTLMKGYYKNEEATKKALRVHADGKLWLHTGDIFSMDDEGYIFFCQRQSRMLVCNGYNIYPTQIESVVCQCPAVAQCCVVGKKDRICGQKIVAVCVLNNKDANKDEVKKSILEYCKKGVADFSMPHEVHFVDELPLTKIGKIDFRTLEAQINS